jgi:hypothetical protein
VAFGAAGTVGCGLASSGAEVFLTAPEHGVCQELMLRYLNTAELREPFYSRTALVATKGA